MLGLDPLLNPVHSMLRESCRWTGAAFLGLSCATAAVSAAEPVARPNILFAIADDASFPHMGAYGSEWVQTPAFDRVAQQGVLFLNAYTPNAKCAPSRACILTGRNSWQLGPIGQHIAVWPAAGYPTFMEVLAHHGYFVGQTGKGWGPGAIENEAPRQLTGRDFSERRTAPPTQAMSTIDYAANFADFLAANEDGEPWCFWYGGYEPHRAYTFGTGHAMGGKGLAEITTVPGFLPDNETVRHDLLDYAFEIEHFDRHLGRMLALLEARGELENTIIG